MKMSRGQQWDDYFLFFHVNSFYVNIFFKNIFTIKLYQRDILDENEQRAAVG